VFLPLFGMAGIEVRMYRPLAAAVVATMSAALVLALTVVPVVSALALAGGRAAGDTWLVRRIKHAYAPLLDRCLRHAGRVRILTLAITLPALALAFFIGRDFMPRLDEGTFLLQTVLPPEASLAEVDRLNHRVEDVLRTFPEVEDVVRRTGRAERTEDPMPHTVSDVLVVLKPDRGRGLEELESAIRAATATVPGVSVLVTTPLGMRIDEGLGGSPADVTVKIFGPDLDQLARLASEAERMVGAVRGLADVRSEAVTGVPQLRVAVDREAAARVGLTPGEVVRALRVALVGEEHSQIWRGQRRFDLVVRLRDDRSGDLAAVRALPVDAHDGVKVPLGQLARIEETLGPVAIRREAGSRRVSVEASVAGRDLAGAADEVRRRLAEGLQVPPGYFVEVGGRVESQARATRALMVAGLVAIAAVFVLLYLALGGLAESLVILATLPDAFVGGILALLISGGTWNVS
jgi:heavy metal efflux system protein